MGCERKIIEHLDNFLPPPADLTPKKSHVLGDLAKNVFLFLKKLPLLCLLLVLLLINHLYIVSNWQHPMATPLMPIFSYLWLSLSICILFLQSAFSRLRPFKPKFAENRYHYSGKVLIIGGWVYLGILTAVLLHKRYILGHSTSLSPWDWEYIILSLIAAVAEEIFFRKILLEYSFRPTSSRKLFIVLNLWQAGIFTLLHIQYYIYPLYLIVVFGMALYYGTLFFFTQKMRYSIIFHLGTNLLGALNIFLIAPSRSLGP